MQTLSFEEENITYAELNGLKYMECVIKETLRLYPSAPFIARYSDNELVTKTGVIIPKDVNVYIHIYDIHRNPKHWENPEKFYPDRFLPANSINRHPFSFVPFSAGARTCIGWYT